MSDKDYYRILGVNRDADDADIKRAYRKLAQEYHPDKHSGDKTVEEKFKTINEAYEILKDPEKGRVTTGSARLKLAVLLPRAASGLTFRTSSATYSRTSSEEEAAKGLSPETT